MFFFFNYHLFLFKHVFFLSSQTSGHLASRANSRTSRQRSHRLGEVDIRCQFESSPFAQKSVRCCHIGPVTGGDAGGSSERRQSGGIPSHPRAREAAEAATFGRQEFAVGLKGSKFDPICCHRWRKRQSTGDFYSTDIYLLIAVDWFRWREVELWHWPANGNRNSTTAKKRRITNGSRKVPSTRRLWWRHLSAMCRGLRPFWVG